MPLDGSQYQPHKHAQVLREAAKLLRKEGWIQDYEHNEDGFCIGGAILYTEHNGIENGIEIYKTKGWDESKGIKLVCEYKKLRHYDYLIDWNNEKERKKEEVINLLENAANYVESQVMEIV